MKNNKSHFNKSSYKNDMELLSKVIKIFSILKLNTSLKKDDEGIKEPLENNEERVLVYYLKHGYSKETKKMIVDDLGIKSTYLNTVNCKLDKKGYLIKDKNNKQKKHLCKGLEDLRKSFMLNGAKTYFILFDQK